MRRQQREYRAHRTVWIDPASVPTVGALVARLPQGTERVYLTGPRPGGHLDGWRAWADDGTLPDGWRPQGHYLENPMLPVLRYAHDDGRTLELHRWAAWIGEIPECTPEDAEAVWEQLGRVILAGFGQGAQPLATPATTGRDLMLRALPHGLDVPTLDAEHVELWQSVSTQGRWQLTDPARTAKLPELAVYDQRFSYAGHAWELGIGPVQRDTVDHVEPYRRGLYRATVRIPDDWHGLGIIPVPADDGGSWEWPETPGARIGPVWIDAAELHTAQRWGWRVERVHERALLRTARPLDRWAAKIATAREQLATEYTRARAHARDTRARRALWTAAALRSVLLHAVGAVHGRPHRVTRSAPTSEPGRVPPDAEDMRVEGDRIVWAERRDPPWRDMVHPEWSAQIWARSRVRTLTSRQGIGALHVPRDRVVAIRGDSVWLDCDPAWSDTGRVGHLRRESVTPGPHAPPETMSELLAIRGGEGYA